MPTTILNACYPKITWYVGPFPPGASQCAPTWPTQEQGLCSRPPEMLLSAAHSSSPMIPAISVLSIGRQTVSRILHAISKKLMAKLASGSRKVYGESRSPRRPGISSRP